MNNNMFKLDVPDFTKEEALEAGKKCLNCKRPFCKEGCPINNNIPEFIQAMLKDDMVLAYELLSEKTNLSAVCGKICPHEKQCQGSCVLNRRNMPVQIGQIENYISNYAHENNLVEADLENIKNQEKLGKVAIVGSGPSGLSCAYMLLKNGFDVYIYEEDKVAGGILAYGIPHYRLSESVIKREVSLLEKMGANFILDTKIGDNTKLEDLKDKYDAICLTTGANNKKSANIEGENLGGVIHANKFLKDFAKYLNNEIQKEDLGITEDDIVVVIGGGNVAMDASRTAKRVSKKTTVVYRRTVEEMPASKAEYHEAVKDEVPFKWRHSPLEFIGENGHITGVRCMNLDDNIEVIEPCTKVLTAIGASPSICSDSINLNKWGYIETSQEVVGLTNLEGVFSCGDVVDGGTVVLAMREGRKVAESIKDYIKNKK